MSSISKTYNEVQYVINCIIFFILSYMVSCRYLILSIYTHAK